MSSYDRPTYIDWDIMRWFTSTVRFDMDLADRAVYLEILWKLYEAGGSCKKDPRFFTRFIGGDATEPQVAAVIEARFYTRPDGTIGHPVVDEKLEEQKNRRILGSKLGKLSAAARARTQKTSKANPSPSDDRFGPPANESLNESLSEPLNGSATGRSTKREGGREGVGNFPTGSSPTPTTPHTHHRPSPVGSAPAAPPKGRAAASPPASVKDSLQIRWKGENFSGPPRRQKRGESDEDYAAFLAEGARRNVMQPDGVPET